MFRAGGAACADYNKQTPRQKSGKDEKRHSGNEVAVLAY
jgi:hypothetical protein